MKTLLLSLVAFVMLAMPVLARPPHVQPYRPYHPYPVHPRFNPHIYGYSWHGRYYNHYVYRNTWFGWTFKRWYGPWSVWLYWAPTDVCWYYYSAGVFVPLDTWNNPNSVPVNPQIPDVPNG